MLCASMNSAMWRCFAVARCLLYVLARLALNLHRSHTKASALIFWGLESVPETDNVDNFGAFVSVLSDICITERE